MKSLKQGPDGERWVVMGVSGCGKSMIGARLAQAMQARFIEGDTFHTAANVAKMAAGIPLSDEDRASWLTTLAGLIEAATARGEALVLSCSALKRRYRDQLRRADPALRFAHLDGSVEVLEQRMRERPGHFMPVSLLASQLRDLEPLQPDEAGIVLEFTAPPQELVASIMDSSRKRQPG